MAWIESHTILVRHPKVKDLARRLRIKPVYALGHLHSLWHNVLELREDGDLSGLPPEDIADFANFTGNAPQFVQHLREAKWLDDNLLHDWLDYAGRYLESKYKTGNPDKLVNIWSKYGKTYFRQTKDGLKTDERPPTIHNLTLPNITKNKNTVTRGSAATCEALKKTDFILRLKDEEKPIFLSSIHQLINEENITRPRNPFQWQPRPRCTQEQDWLSLIYQGWTDDEKIKILTDALNLLNGKMNWSYYVTVGIKYLIRATRKSPIRNHYGFVRMLLRNPHKLASEAFDGILK